MGPNVHEKADDFFMGRRDILFKTWYLNKNWSINYDRYLVVVTIGGHKLKVVQGKKG